MSDAFDQVMELSDKYKRNNKLSDSDSRMASESLKELFGDPGYTELAGELITDLPDKCCRAAVEAWSSGDANRKETIIRTLLTDGYLGRDAYVKRLITIIGAFIPLDPSAALRLLTALSGRLTHEGTKVLSTKTAVRFFRELMANSTLLAISPENYELTAPAVSGIAAMVLSGMAKTTDAEADLREDYLEWLERYTIRPILGASVVSDLEKATKNWPEELQRRCVAAGMIKTVSLKLDKSCSVTPLPGAGPQTRRIASQSEEKENRGTETSIHRERREPAAADREPVFRQGSRPEVRAYLESLAQYISSLENENTTLKKRVDDAESRYRVERMQNSQQTERLAIMQVLEKERESRIDELSLLLDQAVAERIKLEASVREERSARAEEVERLKRRLDHESAFVLEELKNKLADRLARYHREFREASLMSLTPELAEHLKFVCDRIFRELSNNGIRLGGDA